MAVLYIASDQPRAGKTALCVALAQRLAREGRGVALFKPFHVSGPGDGTDPDGHILREALESNGTDAGHWPAALPEGEALGESLLASSMEAFRSVDAGTEMTVVEGIAGLDGSRGELSRRLAEEMDTRVVAVLGYSPDLEADAAVAAKDLFGDRLAGVVINGVTRYKGRSVEEALVPSIEAQGVEVLGVVPEEGSLLGVTVDQLAQHLGGTFLSGEASENSLVERLLVGSLMLDWGVRYFERFPNQAVIVRGDRPDLQMAALAASVSCLVLTGGSLPIEYVMIAAEEAGVPLIRVDGGTDTTLTAVESLQERARFDHPSKQERFQELLSGSGAWEALHRASGI